MANESYIKEYLQVGSSLSKIFHNELGHYVEMKVVRTGEETTVFGFTDKTNEITEINDKIYKDSLTQVGDEFLITFKGISHEVLRTRLEQMRAKAEKIKLQDYIF